MSYNLAEENQLEHFEQEGRGTHCTLLLSVLFEHEDLQVRAHYDEELVCRYAEDMRAGDVFPPIVAFFDAQEGKHWVADGILRKRARQKLNGRAIDVIVYRGSRRDALCFAIRINRKHGNPLTNEDKHRSVRLVLAAYEGEKIGVREIARLVGVSHPFVSRRKEEMVKEGLLSGNGFQIEQSPANKLSSTDSEGSDEINRILVTRNGKKYWQRAKSADKTKLEEPSRQQVPSKGQKPLEAPGPFVVLYVAPPWVGSSSLSFRELSRMKVSSICESDAILFLWVEASMSTEGHQLLEAWGFSYRTQLIWHKTNAGINEPSHENLLIAVRGDFPVPSYEQLGGTVRSLPEIRPGEKPEKFRELIERVFPERAKAELFATQASSGWEALVYVRGSWRLRKPKAEEISDRVGDRERRPTTAQFEPLEKSC